MLTAGPVKVTPCASVARWSPSQPPVLKAAAVHWVVLREQMPLKAVQGSAADPGAAGTAVPRGTVVEGAGAGV